MKRKRIHIPKKGLPVWILADDPDTVWHARIRYALYGFTVLVFVACVLASFIGIPAWRWMRNLWAGCFFVAFFLPLVYYGVRPGKGKIWLISLGILALSFAVPGLSLLLFFVPLVFLGAAMWRSLHPGKGDRGLGA